jgi:large subunit ribosomal protein L4e|tara:strand:+ start:2630 stop:3433 length:804 start_codon:yes stop_codon:yes gene_type:complete
MDIETYNLKGKKLSKVTLPPIFNSPYRPDLIHRAFIAVSSHHLQPQGTDPTAGEKTSAESLGVGRGASRIPRVKGSQFRRASVAAGVASVVGGRSAHPPKAEKIIYKHINRKERRLALASAIAASSDRGIVEKRGHKIESIKQIPLILSDEIETISKAKDLREVFDNLGLNSDLVRVNNGTKKRSGTSRLRGRVTRVPRGPLFILSNTDKLGKAIGSFPGVDCVKASDLSVEHIAPGAHPGRLVVWSESSLLTLPEPLLKLGEKIGS